LRPPSSDVLLAAEEPVQYNNPLMDRDMNQDMDKRDVRLEFTEHIFGNAPTMLALCLTTVGLIKIYTALQRITTLADNFLAFCLAAFLLATIFSYLSLRSSTAKRRAKFAKLADVLFISGLSASTAVAFFVVYALAG
jgi:heme O synthase-like polyprenyltransferase